MVYWQLRTKLTLEKGEVLVLVFENCGWEIDSMGTLPFGSGNDTANRQWEVPDDSNVAIKVMSAMQPWLPVEDENGNLIDIVEIPLSQNESNKRCIEEMKNQLIELDKQTIRPLRAIFTGTDTEEDRSILTDLEDQAQRIRQQMSEIEGGMVQIKD